MTKDELKAYLSDHYSGRLTPLETGRYDLLFAADPTAIKDLARELREDEQLQFDYLLNLGGIDTKERFEVIYNLCSISKNLRIDIKLTLPYEGAEVDSVQEIWPGANWFEREMWELYGINVRGHSNLKRFLLPDDWNQGHPMRKDWSAPDFIKLPEPGA
jgi:NADH:ubiquinone oxidoreductase subunit C